MGQKSGYQITLRIVNKNVDFVGEPLYLAGNFNNWSPGHHCLGDIPEVGHELIATLPDVKEGLLELKLSRGNWTMLQASRNGKLLPPFTVDVHGDTEVCLDVEAWRDQFPPSTASPQVHVLSEKFYFPHLRCSRKIWIYLPKEYADSEDSYPVLYMHDGQHLFDEATSVGRAGPVEWMVDETIDEAGIPAIVVGIDHADTYIGRQQEFLLHPVPGTPIAKGREYLQDIISVLKPYVDTHFRTLSDKANTAMAGSSLGGLITLYAGFLYPEFLGTVGVFSPSIWLDSEKLYQLANDHISQYPINEHPYYYFYVGAKEKRGGEQTRELSMADETLEFVSFLKDRSLRKLELDIDAQGKHGAFYWQQAFKRFYHSWHKQINSL